jgi:hypothetical protein
MTSSPYDKQRTERDSSFDSGKGNFFKKGN